MKIKDFIRNSVLILSLLSTGAISAKEKLFDEERNFRIEELLPECWAVLPAIEPAVPSNFVMKERDCGGVLWGTKEALEKLGDPDYKSTSEVIYLDISGGIVQNGPDDFLGIDNINEEFAELGYTLIKTEKLRWGKYPIFSVVAKNAHGEFMRHAWLGLNEPDGLTISMHQYKFKCEKDNSKIWDTFLQNTRPLDEYDFFCLKGMYLKDGYTYYKFKNSAVKATIERRKSDGQFAIMITPITPETSFTIEDATETLLGSEWKYGDPCMKLRGVLTTNDKNFGNCVVNGVITVAYKEVPEFSFDLNEKNHKKGVQIIVKEADKEAGIESNNLLGKIQDNRYYSVNNLFSIAIPNPGPWHQKTYDYVLNEDTMVVFENSAYDYAMFKFMTFHNLNNSIYLKKEQFIEMMRGFYKTEIDNAQRNNRVQRIQLQDKYMHDEKIGHLHFFSYKTTNEEEVAFVGILYAVFDNHLGVVINQTVLDLNHGSKNQNSIINSLAQDALKLLQSVRLEQKPSQH